MNMLWKALQFRLFLCLKSDSFCDLSNHGQFSFQRTEVSFDENKLVDVLKKDDGGWWLIQVDTKQGWAPATYLEPLDEDGEIDEPELIYGGLCVALSKALCCYCA